MFSMETRIVYICAFGNLWLVIDVPFKVVFKVALNVEFKVAFNVEFEDAVIPTHSSCPK